MGNNGKVMIHGKEYKTVALRVQEMRAEHPTWGIMTELVESSSEYVVMKCEIYASEEEGARLIGSGYAEERRDSSQINRTSALENCETSAIGRALAACGYGGSEYASANEVENAIAQQKPMTEPAGHKWKKGEKEKVYEQARKCLDDGDEHGLREVLEEYDGPDEKMKVWGLFNSSERSSIKALLEDEK